MEYRGIHLPDKDEPKVPGREVGKGATATIYEWGRDKVIKLYNVGYPLEAISKEYYNALAIKKFSFNKAIAYELKNLPLGYGIIYSHVRGESLLDYVIRTGDIDGTIEHMCSLQEKIHECRLSGEIETVKSFLRRNILCSKQADSAASREMLRMVELLSEGDTLCHGDFHPGNIILTEEGPTVIDFMNICRGDALYDIARTFFLMVYTPVPEGVPNEEQMQELKRGLGDAYLDRMGKTTADIGGYLSMIIAARGGELGEDN